MLCELARYHSEFMAAISWCLVHIVKHLESGDGFLLACVHWCLQAQRLNIKVPMSILVALKCKYPTILYISEGCAHRIKLWVSTSSSYLSFVKQVSITIHDCFNLLIYIAYVSSELIDLCLHLIKVICVFSTCNQSVMFNESIYINFTSLLCRLAHLWFFGASSRDLGLQVS